MKLPGQHLLEHTDVMGALAQPTNDQCTTCGKATKAECSRVDCSNRKPETARPPEAMSPTGHAGSGCYRVPMRSTH